MERHSLSSRRKALVSDIVTRFLPINRYDFRFIEISDTTGDTTSNPQIPSKPGRQQTTATRASLNQGFSRCGFLLRHGAVRCGLPNRIIRFCLLQNAPNRTVRKTKHPQRTAPSDFHNNKKVKNTVEALISCSLLRRKCGAVLTGFNRDASYRTVSNRTEPHRTTLEK